jgi:hypothetical protein
MATTRKSIRLSPDDDALLRHLYLEEGIPSDQYSRRSTDLVRFIGNWNRLAERNDTAEDILHYIKTKRKKKLWVTFDGKHQTMPTITEDVLAAEEWVHLRSIYERLFIVKDMGSDNLAYDAELARSVSREFARLSGRELSGQFLLAIIMVKRKRGDWPKINPDNSKHKGVGFGDIDQIAN